MIDKLKQLKQQEVKDMIASIPKEWEVDANAQNSLLDLIVNRASFLESDIQKMILEAKNENHRIL